MRLPRFPRFLLLALLLGSGITGSEAKAPKLMDLADTVAANRILSKFEAMMQSSEMITFLSTKGPFTLFVPTDAAFSKLPPALLNDLLRPENKERLQHILLFHVVNGKRFSAKDLQTQTTLISCEGSPLAIKTMKSGTQMVGKARIIHGDIRCQNGVIHEIDTLLMPPEAALPPLAPPAPPAPPVDPNAPPVTPPPATNAIMGAVTPTTPVTPNEIPTAPVATPGALTP